MSFAETVVGRANSLPVVFYIVVTRLPSSKSTSVKKATIAI
jgi:hypothetical protein